MGKPYSMDLRERVVAAIEDGESTHQAAARFAIGIATAGAWARLKRSTGDVRPAKQGKPSQPSRIPAPRQPKTKRRPRGLRFLFATHYSLFALSHPNRPAACASRV
jgi:transposase